MEGSTADSASLSYMIDKLRLKAANLIVKVGGFGAGITTEEKLRLIQGKGYDYMCVSRSKIENYSIKDGEVLHRIKTQNKEEISAQMVHHQSKPITFCE